MQVPPFQGVRFNSLPLEYGLGLMAHSHFTPEKPGWHHLNKWSKLTSLVISHIDIISPDMIHEKWKGHFTSVVFFKNSITHLLMGKHQATWIWEVFHKLPILFKIVEIMKNKKRLRTVQEWKRLRRHDD